MVRDDTGQRIEMRACVRACVRKKSSLDNLVDFVADKHGDDVVFCRVRLKLAYPLIEFHERLFTRHVVH